MPKFSESSKQKLSTCHPDLQNLFNEVIKYFDCTIIEGFRNEEDQNQAFKTGNSKLKWPNGKHNKSPSNAVDVVPYPIDWKDTNRMRFFAGMVLGIAQMMKAQGRMNYAVRWGGDWNMNTDLKDQSFNDFPHFELVI